MLARWPAGIAAPGTVVDEFVTLADVAPTLLDVADLPSPPGLTGRSMRPFLQGIAVDDWRQEVCSQFNGVELGYTQRSVQTKQFKYVFNGFDFDELYDLTVDADEMVNRIDDPELDEVKLDLIARLWRFALDQDDDYISNPYMTVALMPEGPLSLRGDGTTEDPPFFPFER